MTGPQRHAACPRSWEVSAARDDRLLQKDLESLERHLTACDVCRAKQQQLETLSESLRELPPVPDDALAARRLRHRLLADANRWMIGQATAEQPARRLWTGRTGLLVAAAIAASAVVATGVGYRALGARRASATPAASSPNQPAGDARVDITARAGAQWQKQQLGDELRIQLDAGEITASIGRHRPGQLVRIQLPDGWIDDLGTVLSVRVEAGHTRHVHVDEGRVRLRLDGHEPLELGAGEGWTTTAEQASDSPPASPPASAASAAARAPSAHHASAAPVSAPTTSSPTAEALLAARQAREEDETYLHIVALARAHQLDEARAAAKDYLRRFPNGFRREEVQGVASH